jgi:hypothetical protein
MEPTGFSVDDVLRQYIDAAGVILYVDVVVLEPEIHGVQKGDQFSCTEIHPHEFLLAGFAAHECDEFVEMHPETLVHVFLSGALPADVLLVFPVAKLEIVFDCLPVDRSCCCQSNLVIWGSAQQLRSIVLVSDVNDHRLYAADDLFSVSEVGQLDGGVFIYHFGQVLFFPFFLCQIDVFFLFVRHEDVLEHQTHHLQLTPYRPVDQSYLLFFRNVHLCCQFPQSFLFVLLHLLSFTFLLFLSLGLVLLFFVQALGVGEEIGLSLRVAVEIGDGSFGVAVHPVHVAAETAHTTHAAKSHTAHSPETASKISTETAAEASSKTAA